ncbi:MAG: hypothetical protein HFG54_01980 [Lachnospiraceae bacterium]|jgi:hypothetical protein|nr:hypothetical protein [Lachnospiraceae bacterium]
MADYEVKRRANIGSSSLILIFIVLCLATFGLLSLGNAKGDELLSVRNAAAVKAYYQADGQGEEFVHMVDQALQKAGQAGDDLAVKKQVLETVGDYYQEASGRFLTDIPMEAGQALRVELDVDWKERSLKVASWKVYIQEEYAIDQSVRVWSKGE